MDFLESAEAVITASGEEAVDWTAVSTAAQGATNPGSLSLSEAEKEGYASDVRAARSSIKSVAGMEFTVPETIEIQNRHHWIDANIETFERVFEPLADQPVRLPRVSRPLNTASVAGSLAFIARHVLGQYDPLLLADGDEAHGLYFVHPNVVKAARTLDVGFPRFRRWIAFHEVTHAAEFGAAPWLSSYLSGRLEEAIEELTRRRMPREAFQSLNLAMTAVEGFAELLMDETFDEEYDDLRRKLEARRAGGNPIQSFIRRLLGFQLKREQYEQGRAFFDDVVAERGIEGAAVVWQDPAYLPSREELETPRLWLDRVPTV